MPELTATEGCIVESSEGIFEGFKESERLASEVCTGTGGELLVARSNPEAEAET